MGWKLFSVSFRVLLLIIWLKQRKQRKGPHISGPPSDQEGLLLLSWFAGASETQVGPELCKCSSYRQTSAETNGTRTWLSYEAASPTSSSVPHPLHLILLALSRGRLASLWAISSPHYIVQWHHDLDNWIVLSQPKYFDAKIREGFIKYVGSVGWATRMEINSGRSIGFPHVLLQLSGTL